MNNKQYPIKHWLNGCKTNHESGVALITAMLVTALATVASVAMLSSQQLDSRRVENILHFDQAYLYALGVEGAAAKYLENDPTPNVDTKGEFDLFELYLGTGSGTEIEGGTVSGKIRQLSGYFPLNNQINGSGNQNPYYIAAFGELLQQIKAKYSNQELFAQGFEWVVADWIDRDDIVGPRGGAEDSDYANRFYRTANRPMQSLSELRLLGITKEGFAALNGVTIDPLTGERQLVDPWVNVVPYFAPRGAAININVVDEMVLRSVLQSFFPAISDATVSQIIQEQGNVNAKDDVIGMGAIGEMTTIIVDSLDDTPPINDSDQGRFLRMNLIDRINFDVKTEYFEAVSIAQIGNTVVELKTLMRRDQNRVAIVKRGIGVY